MKGGDAICAGAVSPIMNRSGPLRVITRDVSRVHEPGRVHLNAPSGIQDGDAD
jgi:hypothetical protein